jgi:hypothetical protein
MDIPALPVNWRHLDKRVWAYFNRTYVLDTERKATSSFAMFVDWFLDVGKNEGDVKHYGMYDSEAV